LLANLDFHIAKAQLTDSVPKPHFNLFVTILNLCSDVIYFDTLTHVDDS